MAEREVLYDVNIKGAKKVTDSFSKIKSEVKKSGGEFKNTKNAMDIVESENKDLVKSNKKLAKSQKETNKEQAKTNKNLNNTAKSGKKAGGGLKAFGKAATMATGGLILVVATIIKLANGLQNLITRTEEGQFAWEEFRAEVDVTTGIVIDRIGRMSREMFNFSDESKGLGSVWKNLKTTFTDTLSTLKTRFMNFIKSPLEGFKSLYKGMDGFATGLRDSIVGGIEKAFETALENIKRFTSGIVLAYEKAVNVVSDNQDDVDAAFKRYETASNNAKKANKEFTDAIKNTSGYKAIQGAIDGISESVKSFNDDISQAQDKANALQKRQNALTVANREQTIRNAKLDRQIAEERAKAVNLQETDINSAVEAQKEAIRLEKVKMEENMALVREQLEITKAKNKLTDSQTADLQREADLEAQLIQIQTRNAERERTYATRLITLERKKRTALKKTADQKKKEEQEEKERLAAKLERQRLEKEQANAEFESYMARKKTEEERKIAQLTSEFNRIEQLYKRGDLTKKQYAKAEQRYNKKTADVVKKTEAQKSAARRQAAGILIGSIGNSVSAMAEGTKFEAAAAKFQKATSIAKSIANISAGLATTSSIGFPQNIPMIAGFIAQTAGIVNNIKSLVAPKPPKEPKLAHGGMIGGKPHSSGGTKFTGSDGSSFEAERGEYLAVVNKRDAKRAAMLDSVNSEHGNSFGINSDYMAKGGVLTPKQNFQKNDTREIVEETISQFAKIPVVVSERDITDTQQRVRSIEVEGNL